MARQEPQVGEIWKHWKGGTYIVLGFAIHESTLQKLVLYTKCVDGQQSQANVTWARAMEDFMSDAHDGVYRFCKAVSGA